MLDGDPIRSDKILAIRITFMSWLMAVVAVVSPMLIMAQMWGPAAAVVVASSPAPIAVIRWIILWKEPCPSLAH